MPDMTGIMCSYDNFPMYGLSSYIQSQWIAAMKSMMEGAQVMGDDAAYKEYEQIYKKGSELMDTYLWNGEYYILSKDYTGLCKDMKDADEEDQACLTDQIIGQWIAHQSSLGYLFKEEHVKKALQKVMEMSFKKGFGLRNCSWPEYPDLYPIHESDLWVDQANTPWTGVELAFASFLIYEDMVEDGMAVIREVDNRQRKAGLYWDHQEFGGHYYRPMAAWQIMNAFLGLGINQDTYSFDPKIKGDDFKVFFSFNHGTAHFIKQGNEFIIKVLTGTFTPDKIILPDNGSGDKMVCMVDGNAIKTGVSMINGRVVIDLPSGLSVAEGSQLSFR